MEKNQVAITEESLKRFENRLGMMTGRELTLVTKSALKSMGNKTLKETRQNVRHVLKNANAKSKKYPTMTPPGKGGGMSVNKDGTRVKINIMQPFLLPIFEKGTVPRFLKGHASSYTTKTNRRYTTSSFRGEINPKRFFASAIQKVNATAKEDLDEMILKKIQRKYYSGK
jgi:hypothetical protein